MKRIAMLSLLFGLLHFFGYAQQVDKGFELYELLKIYQVYKQIPHLSFEMEYTYADSVQPAVVQERLRGTTKISNSLSWQLLDSTLELVEGQRYIMGIYYSDSIITVSNRPPSPGVLQLPLMDSLFRAALVDSMCITGKQNGEKLLSIFFRPTSMYSHYRLYYDARTSLINRIEYYTKTINLSEEEGGSGTSLITLRLSQYSFDPVPGELFREERILFKNGRTFTAAPAFADFKIIDNTVK
jgi:hypothetical protein